MRIVALIENCGLEGRDELKAEHGLSLYVERGDDKLLFDTGATGAFADNARHLGVGLGDIDVAVISHHHYDHGGGLAAFLEANDRAPVYLGGSEVVESRFRAFLGLVMKPIGLDRSLIDSHSDRFEFVVGEREPLPGVSILTDISNDHPRPKGNRRILARRGDSWVPDAFDHELLMVVEEAGALVVFTGCSHRGILNLVETAVRRFPDRPIKAVIGGFHLIGLPVFNTMAGTPREVRALGRALLDLPVDKYYTGHCTGAKAYTVLAEVMGDRLERFPTGSEAVI